MPAETDRKQNLGDAAGASERSAGRETQPDHASKTSGTNRDFDESGESANQAHGHPREEKRR